jgi:hypothetical protein
MNVQQHERIAHIKKLSGYMYIALRWMVYLLKLAWPLAVISALVGEKFTLTFASNTHLSFDDASYLHRTLAVVLVSIVLFCAIKIMSHFRDLMRHFHQGEIFNSEAIVHARKALFNALVLWGIGLTIQFGVWLCTLANVFLPSTGAKQGLKVNIGFDGDIFLGLIFFGLMYLLLWALEIGRDLNEESELTI